MAQPTPYNRLANFTDYATNHPAAPYNPASFDAELNSVETTLDQTLTNLAKIQRDDGKIKNATVHPDSLDTATLAIIASSWLPRGLWATDTLYRVGEVIEHSGVSYVGAVQHTSGTFNTDHAAGKWIVLGTSTVTTPTAGDVSFTPSGSLGSTTVQAAIVELDTDLTAHVTDAVDAHDASAISYAGSDGLSTTTVEAALDELDTEKAPKSNAAFSGSFVINYSASMVGALDSSGWAASAQSTAQAGFSHFQYGTSTPIGFSGYRARGSFAGASDSLADDVLALFAGFGWNTDTWRSAGYAVIEQDGYTAGSAAVPGRFRIWTVNASGVAQENLQIDSTGRIRMAGQAAASGYTNRGDITLPATGVIRAKNTVKAWVKFDGTAGTIVRDDHFNVASITDHGAGDFTITFTNAIANANYALFGSARGHNSSNIGIVVENHVNAARSASAVRCFTLQSNLGAADMPVVSVGVIGE